MFEKTPASRRYTRRCVAIMLAYIASLFLTEWIVSNYCLAGAALYLLALLPALPLVGVIAVMGFYLAEESDEYVRMQSVRMMLFATGFMLAVSTVWGFLTSYAAVPGLPLQYVFPLWCVGLALSCGRMQRA